MNKTLEMFLRTLKEYGYSCRWEEASEAINFERIIVDLGNDSKGRNRSLLVRLIDYPISANEKDAEHAIQLFTAFPFSFKEASAAELSRLLMYYNNSLEFPGFGLYEISRHIYYRQMLIKPSGFINKRTFIAFIGALLLIIEAFSDTIEEVAEGKSMKQALTDTLNMLKKAA